MAASSYDHTKVNTEHFVRPFWFNVLEKPKFPPSVRLDRVSHFLTLHEKTFNISNPILPKGTLLYHGSAFSDPLQQINQEKSSSVFFGIDVDIAIWYTSELFNAQLGEQSRFYLNVYELKIDLPYKYLKENVCRRETMQYNPKLDSDYSNISIIHPQFAFQSYVGNCGYMSTEISIPLGLLSNLSLVQVFSINATKLYENAYNEYNCLDSIMFEEIELVNM